MTIVGTYVHLAGKAWAPGQPLRCWDQLIDRGILAEADWNWPEANTGADGGVICLFNLADESDRVTAERLISNEPWRTVVLVDLDAAIEDEGLRTTIVAEGYTAVLGCIPADYLAPMPSLSEARRAGS